MKKVFITLVLIIIPLWLIYDWFQNDMVSADACLCTEILSNDQFIKNKNKMPSVSQCLKYFDSFDKAHESCIENFDFKHPEIKIDSLKSIWINPMVFLF